MQTEFMKIFWGLLIVAVDITIDEFDLLLPDVIGYVLIYLALGILTPVNAQFAKARPFTIVAGVVWVVSQFHIVPAPITGIAATLMDLMITWYICTGIMLLAIERANPDLAQTAVSRRSAIVAMSLTNLAVAAVALQAPEFVRPIAIPLVVMSLTIGLLVLLLIRRASVEIN